MSHSKVQERILGLIPAKSRSLRLPRKNVLDLGGRPLIAWAAEAARASGILSRLIISTDDEEVAGIARHHAIDVPFLRPTELARDPAGVVEVALHAVESLAAGGETYDTLVILLPTCPFRTAEDISEAYRLFHALGRPCLMSVSEFDHTPFAAMERDDQGRLRPLFPELLRKRSQQMPRAYRPNGAIHVLDILAFKREQTYFFEPLVGYVMPRERSIDIDTALDLQFARTLLAAGGVGPGSNLDAAAAAVPKP